MTKFQTMKCGQSDACRSQAWPHTIRIILWDQSLCLVGLLCAQDEGKARSLTHQLTSNRCHMLKEAGSLNDSTEQSSRPTSMATAR